MGMDTKAVLPTDNAEDSINEVLETTGMSQTDSYEGNLLEEVAGEDVSTMRDSSTTIMSSEGNENASMESCQGAAPSEGVDDESALPEHPTLTYVRSNPTGIDVVPKPVTERPPIPQCNSWAAKGIGRVVEDQRPVGVLREQIIYKRVPHYVERPVEVVTHRPKIIVKERVEFRKKVTDEEIVVPKPYIVETKKFVPRYIDQDKTCIVAQTLKPVLTFQGNQDVPAVIYEPEIIPVDVKIPKLVYDKPRVRPAGTVFKQVPQITAAQWNSLVIKLNPHLAATGQLDLMPVRRDATGNVVAFKPSIPVGKPVDISQNLL